MSAFSAPTVQLEPLLDHSEDGWVDTGFLCDSTVTGPQGSPDLVAVCSLYLWHLLRDPPGSGTAVVLGTVELGIDSALFAPEFRLYDCMGAPSGDLVLLGSLCRRQCKRTEGGTCDGISHDAYLALAGSCCNPCSSVFTISGSGGFRTPLAQYLSPVLLLATLCVAVIQSLRRTNLESQVLASGDTALREAIDAPLLPDRVTSVTEKDGS